VLVFQGHEESLAREDFANAIAPTEKVSDTLRERLLCRVLCRGFIRINSTGLFTVDRYEL
jgi:hypothetical protein